MKNKLFKFLVLAAAYALLFQIYGFGANTTIKDITTTSVLPATNDYTVQDGATYGTRKFLGSRFSYLTTTRTTLAALSITGAADGLGIYVLGGSAAGDGNGSFYYWAASSTATPNGNTVIQPATLPGTGRWLKSTGGTAFPGASTLGGVFSNSGTTNYFVSAINTDGTVTLSQVAAAGITGLGSMAFQNSNAVAITGGTAALTSATISTPLAGASGGTGVANTGKTITLGGNLTLSGAFNGTLTLTGTTSVTLPTSGTLATLAGTEALSNKTITASAFNGTIGATTPSTAVVTNLTANLVTRTGTSTNNSVWGVVSDDVTSNMLTFNNVATSAGMIGISGGGGTDKTLYLRTPTAGGFDFLVGNTFAGRVTSTGINATAIGVTTPSTGIFTTLASNSNANIQTTKGNFNEVLNVRDFGAKGDGSSNDTVAVTNARIAALASKAVLYFPGSTGAYMVDSSALNFSGAAGLGIMGDGKGASIIKCRTPGQALHASGSRVSVWGLTFDGSCTTRTAGQQAVVFDCSQSIFTNNEIINSGEYAFFSGSSTSVTDLIVTDNLIRACYADGINLQNVQVFTVANNVVDGADDDLIALGYNGLGACAFGVVSGNTLRARTDVGTTWGRGILAERVTDCLIVGNYLNTIKQTGIYVNGAGSRASRVRVKDNVIRNAAVNSGSSIAAYQTTDCSFEGNDLLDQGTGGALFDIADWQNLSIIGGTLTYNTNSVFMRGIHTDEGSGWAASWDRLYIHGVTINLTGSSTAESIYLNPTAGVTMNTLVVDSVVSYQNAAGNYITVGTSRIGTLAKIINNTTAAAGRTVSTGGIIVTANNN